MTVQDTQLRQCKSEEDKYFKAIEDRNAAVMSRNETIKEQDGKIKEQDAQLTQKDAQLTQKDAQLSKLIQKLKDQGLSDDDIEQLIK
ncbi:MAG: hypothetical protein PUD58_05640 [Prevotella sp.]|uniref:hypothetical protein n=1 Tax=Prevotella sp. TaxID=59823 RepID=UPI002585C916|nr:hypothetical protein [Prevotella sp.]MDD6853775.1 hypothetical protein [Prevotella sp.]